MPTRDWRGRRAGGTWRLLRRFFVIRRGDFREIRVGQQVQFTYEDPGFLQDNCPFRALAVAQFRR